MSATVKLLWRGNQIKEATAQAVVDAMDTTLLAAVEHAQRNAPRRTGQLANSLTMEGTKRSGSGYEGSFGSYTVNYAVYVELGTRFMGAQPYLRPAADAEFPKLPGRIGGIA